MKTIPLPPFPRCAFQPCFPLTHFKLAWLILLLAVSAPAQDFQINSLTPNNAVVTEVSSLAGDDRGGIAASGSRVFLTGDSSTARLNRADLSGGAPLGVVWDALASDLKTETVYLLANGSTPVASVGSLSFNSLVRLDGASGLPDGAVISLSLPIALPDKSSSAVGIFSGWGRVVIHNGTRVYEISLPSGTVTDLGGIAVPQRNASESWAYWGVAETIGGFTHLTYVRNSTTIARTRVADGMVTTAATFANLGDMASFTVVPSLNRWYFHHESGSQFGAFAEALGFADATFVLPPGPPVISSQPLGVTVITTESAAFSVAATGTQPLAYQWRKADVDILEATNSTFAIASTALADAGSYTVVITNVHGAVTSAPALLTLEVISADHFKIASLRTNNFLVVNPLDVAGDDRGGLVASDSRVFLRGDDSVGSFSLTNLDGALRLGTNEGGQPVFFKYDSLISDLRSQKVYVLGNGSTAITETGGTATTLIEIDGRSGVPVGAPIALSSSIALGSGGLYTANVGLFSGWGRLVIHNGANVYSIDPASGMVTDLGPMARPARVVSESWAYWGVAEYWGGSVRLVHARDAQSIVRTAVPGGATEVVGSFANLNDLASFTVVPGMNRWYFHNETINQFSPYNNYGGEILGYADASFICQAPPVGGLTFSTSTVTVMEDSGAATMLGLVTGAPSGTATFTVVNSSNSLFSVQPAVSPAGTLTFTPAANANGSATVTVTARDGGGASLGSNAFTLTVTPVNDAPLLVMQARPTTVAFFNDTNYVWTSELPSGGALLTNLGVAVVPFTDFASAVGAYSVIVVPSMHTALVPSLNTAARASISNFVHTGGVLVVMGNHVPSVQVADLMNAVFGYSLIPYRLLGPSVQAATAAGTPFADDSPWLWANDQESYAFMSLPPNARVIYQRDGVGWDESSVTVFSVGSGRAVTLGGQFSQSFIWSGEGTWLPVLASAITPVQLTSVVSEDAGPQTIAGFASPSRAGPTNESGQTVSYVVASDNPTLFSAQPAISGAGALTFTPAANSHGTATVTVYAQDNGGTANGGVDMSAPQTFTLTVTPVNDAPTIAFATNNVVVMEDSAGYSGSLATFGVGPANESGQNVTNVMTSNDNTALFSVQPSVSLGGTLTFSLAANASGVATVIVTVQDNGGTSPGVDTATNTFLITVTAVNDAPGFALAPVGREGTVVAWGKNNSGQITVPGAPLRAVGLSANADHTLALKADGTVVAWGRNDFGQTTVPGGVSGVVTVAAGGDHSLALKSDGAVVAWGRNQFGQTDVPAGLNRVVALSAGVYHNLALRNDGTVVAWGANNVGQATVPPALNGVVAVEAGHEFSLALLNDGTVVAWGENTYHETEVPAGLSNVVAIAAGGQHALALKSDGTVVAWGRNTFGSGNTGTGLSEVPVGLAGVVAIAANGEHNLALKSDGTVVAWGRNQEGQTSVPVGLSGAVSVGAGYYHSAALADATGSPQVTVLEDSGPQTMVGMARNISAGLSESASQLVSFTVTNDNNALFSTQPAIAASGTLTFTPATNANGSAIVTVIAADDGGTPGVSNSAPQTFVITITPVNDAPSFNLSSTNVTVFPGDGGVVVRPNWVMNRSAGPVNEAGQTVTVERTNSNPAMFIDQPVILADGTLEFTPEPTASGMVTVGVRVVDNGGTANGGADTSGWQAFTITFATVKVFVSESPTVIAGTTVEVPISLAGIGNEGGASFTITYDRPQLVFMSLAVESGSGLTLTWSEPYGGMMNNVGIIVTKPAGSNFTAGTNMMVRLTFQAPIGTAPTNTPISFSSAVVIQQVSDTNANVVTPVLYVPGSVTIIAVPPLESDVAPRNAGGNGAVTVSDAVQLTRFVAGWDTITDFAANGEFQRADCAPRGSLGDGRVTLVDLVQTLRYAAGLDPATPAGGPTIQAASLSASSPRLTAGSRVVRVVGGNLAAGRANNVSIQLDAQGNEAGVSLSVSFDPTAMTFVNASVGSGASGGSLMVNDAKAAAGRVGLVLVMPAGTGIAAGPRDIITLTFNVAGVTGSTVISVSGDTPVRREVADVSANMLGASFLDGSLNLLLPPGLKAAGLERAADGSLRLVVVNGDGSPVMAAQAAKYEVHVTSDLGGAWTLLPDALVIENGALKIVDPAARSAGLRLYKLVELP